MINEIAPRPHNSGHYTIEACPISQYEAHIRAILDLPLPENSTSLTTPSIMLNILGSDSSNRYLYPCEKALHLPGAHIHLYGKSESRKGRKMGHITFTGRSMNECEKLLDQCLETTQEGAVEQGRASEVAVIMGSDSDLPVMSAGCQILEDFGVVPDVTVVSAHRTPERMVEFAKSAVLRGVKVIIAGAGGIYPSPITSHSSWSLILFCRGSTFTWDGCCDDGIAGNWSSCKSNPSRRNGFIVIDCSDACTCIPLFFGGC
jgi:phosphoribosylaminoimidazole carboxylase